MQALLTKKEVAQILGLQERSVNTLMTEGKLPYIKINRAVRFDPKDVEAFIQRQKRTPGKQSPA